MILRRNVRRELEAVFKSSDIPILIIDEYDKLGERKKTNELMANTIKSLSDYGVNVTVILVGVADNINDLMGEHASFGRCVEQIPMPRMNTSERKEILENYPTIRDETPRRCYVENRSFISRSAFIRTFSGALFGRKRHSAPINAYQ